MEDSADSSEVSQFLLHVRELGERADREDELRAKQLEQEIAEGRRRRQALRAERSRSTSPVKPFSPQTSGSNGSNGDISSPPPSSDRTRALNSTVQTLVGKKEARRLFPSGDGPANRPPSVLKPSSEVRKASSTKPKPNASVENDFESKIDTGRSKIDTERVSKSTPQTPAKPESIQVKTPADRSIESSFSRLNISTPASASSEKYDSPLGSIGRASKRSPLVARLASMSAESPEQSPRQSLQSPTSASTFPQSSRRVSGPKPPPKPVNLTPRDEKSPSVSRPLPAEPTPSKQQSPSTGAGYSLNKLSAHLGHVKSNSISSPNASPAPASMTTLDEASTPKLDPTAQDQSSPSMLSRSRSKSPVRPGGFVQSAMLKREGTISRSSPGQGLESPISMQATTRQSPANYTLRSSPRLGGGDRLHLSASSAGTDESPRETADISAALSKSTSDATSKVDVFGASSPSLAPNDLSPARNGRDTGENSPIVRSESRRWSPVRQQPTWLESALKKNNASPTPEEGLVRSGTLARNSSRSPVRNSFLARSGTITGSPSAYGHAKSFSVDRITLNSPDLSSRSPGVKESPTVSSFKGSPGVAARDSLLKGSPGGLGKDSISSPLRGSPTTGEKENASSMTLPEPKVESPAGRPLPPKPELPKKKSIEVLRKAESPGTRRPFSYIEPKSAPSDEPEEIPALARRNTLKPPPPKPASSKPTPEALERLRSLRPSSPVKKDRTEEIEAVEKLRSLRPSSPVKHTKEEEIEAIEKLRNLRASPTKTSRNEKTEQEQEAEAIERLHRLRSSSPTKQQRQDEAKQTLEKAISGLRRSNTQQFKPSDEAKETLLAAKSSLRRSGQGRNPLSTSNPLKEENEPEDETSTTEFYQRSNAAKSTGSFATDLESALKMGPPPPNPPMRKARTIDTGELAHSAGGKLTHPNKKRAKGPKRRLPTQVSNGSSRSELSLPKQRTLSSSGRPKPEIRKPSSTVSKKQPPPRPRTSSRNVKMTSSPISSPTRAS
uniref:ARAD1C11110p n=1 Tax=Blastobotrys adeninivorans TaxID=409370 RepID=A0A060T0U0_BLAAD